MKEAITSISDPRRAIVGPRRSYPRAVESALEAAPDGGRPEISGPIGVALGPSGGRLGAELVESVLAGAADLGREACVVRPGDDQSHLGILLGVGHPDNFLPVFAAPPACPRIIWVTEPLLLRDEPHVGPLTHVTRSPLIDHVRSPLQWFKDARLPGPFARMRASATIEHQRARHVRDLARLASNVDRVVVTSRDRRTTLLHHGLNAEAVPFGYSAATAGPLTPPSQGSRDLDFVSLGVLHARLAGRRSVVTRWRVEEPRLTVLDGVWGRERGDLLRRSRVVLNVGRTPGNFVGVRLVLAIAAGAVVVSEPIADPFPFVVGVHFVEAPLEGLLDAARELCADEPRRRRIGESGQALLAGELSMAQCLSRALGLVARPDS
jgi:hypothetical protein